jgi:hypothetical protein
VLLDDAVHHGEAEAEAVARLLGRVERLEDVRQRVGVDADARIPHRQVDEAAGPRPRPAGRELLPE